MPRKDTPKPKKASSLDDLRRVCRPEPLRGAELDAFYVETDKARDPHRDTRRNLEASLEDEFAKVLLYGHRGCGKSTELNRFLAECPDAFLPVHFSVLDEMQPVNARAEDIILVIIERLLRTVQKEDIQLDNERLEMIYGWFSNTTREVTKGRGASAEIGAGVDASSSPLGKLIGLFAHFKGEVKFNSYSEETSVSTLRKRPADLIARANEILRATQEALRKKKDSRRLLVVVEDMDKLDLKQAHDIYVRNPNLLTGLDARIIYTIPIFLFHSPDANVFRNHFTECVPLPMIKVTDPGAKGPTKSTQGFETVKKIILKRIDSSLIADAALSELITRTGGVLRHVFEVLHHVSTMADVEKPILTKHIEYGLKQVRRELWQMIALPLDRSLPGMPDSVEILYDRLTECARQQLAGEKPVCNSDAVNQILLKSCALVEYNGEGWVGVHPLVIESLKRLGRLGQDGR